MADQNLLTIFVAVTAAAVLIQTGIVAGLCYASFKISRQAERAAAEARQMYEPMQRLVETLESASYSLADFSASSKGSLHQLESTFDRTLDRFRRKLA